MRNIKMKNATKAVMLAAVLATPTAWATPEFDG